VAFFGPDGVGKSAVIEQVKEQLGPAFCGVRQFHFRPGFGRLPLDTTPVTDPHGQAPRGLLISLAKLVYWLLDCWYGYWIAVRSRRRKLVMSDRYYPDILVDPRRYRLPESSLGFARWLVTLAPHPDLCVLLDAPAEVVQCRKCEVSLSESRRQRLAYVAMLHSRPHSLLVDASGSVNKVAQEVCAAILALTPNSSVQETDVLLVSHY
jgi:thymidylate kinase